jgi:hypothetical protein
MMHRILAGLVCPVTVFLVAVGLMVVGCDPIAPTIGSVEGPRTVKTSELAQYRVIYESDTSDTYGNVEVKWYVDGDIASENDTLSVKFSTPGSTRVKVVSLNKYAGADSSRLYIKVLRKN